jgi:hypothetical protein
MDDFYASAFFANLTIHCEKYSEAHRFAGKYGIKVEFVLLSGGSTAPSIVTQPFAKQTARVGDTVGFFVKAAEGGTLTYQWYFNDTALSDDSSAGISGANSARLRLDNVSAANAGTYTVQISNSIGNVTSNAAVLTVHEDEVPPVPLSVTTVTAGGSVTFSIVPTGTGTESYQWYFNSNPIPEASAASYTIANASAANAGIYTVRVTNAAGRVTASSAARLTVPEDETTPDDPETPTTPTTPENPDAPTTPDDPEDPTIPTTPENPDDTETPVTPDPPETGSIAGIAAKGVKLTAPKTLVVPKGVKRDKGTKAVDIWKKDCEVINKFDKAGNPISAKTFTAKEDGVYSVELWYSATDAAGNAVEVPAPVELGKVKLFVPPKIAKVNGFVATPVTGNAQTGVANSVVLGETLRLTVTLEDNTGTPSVNYIWYKNGKLWDVPTLGSTSLSDWRETDAFGAKADSYSVVVETAGKDAKGKPLATAKSKAIKPKVILPPTVGIKVGKAVLSEATLPLVIGKTLTLTTKATGTAKLTYVWYKDGSDIPILGATKASLSIKNATAADAGVYRVVVTNAAGVGHSDEASATVTAPEVPAAAGNGSLRLASGAISGTPSSSLAIGSAAALPGSAGLRPAEGVGGSSTAVGSATLGTLRSLETLTTTPGPRDISDALAPAALATGTVLAFENGDELAILSDTEISGGTYAYERLSPTTARLSYALFTEDGAIETGELLLDFTAPGVGRYELRVDDAAGSAGSVVKTGGFVLEL